MSNCQNHKTDFKFCPNCGDQITVVPNKQSDSITIDSIKNILDTLEPVLSMNSFIDFNQKEKQILLDCGIFNDFNIHTDYVDYVQNDVYIIDLKYYTSKVITSYNELAKQNQDFTDFINIDEFKSILDKMCKLQKKDDIWRQPFDNLFICSSISKEDTTIVLPFLSVFDDKILPTLKNLSSSNINPNLKKLLYSSLKKYYLSIIC